MKEPNLKERVAALEKQVAVLQAHLTNTDARREKDWRRTVGMFAGDEVMQQVFEEGHKIREAERRQAKRQDAKRKRASA